MKTIKEGFLRKNLGLGKEVLIKKWLDEQDIRNYTINDDLTIDVKGNVHLDGYTEKQLPEYIQFGKVTGRFSLMSCSNLESLKGCPQEVRDYFSCTGCINLKSLEGAPQEVGEDFSCKKCGKKFKKSDVENVCEVKGLIIV